ncbi:response regulator [Roseomonas sp. CCTCC AB2023176]|uniref:response regulator n=1 Tax=Roseomonas sp. CCTCC AB2023176 TaxID=3342640 RepID=UPI0035DBFB3E
MPLASALRVLVVEDQASMRAMIVNGLKTLGITQIAEAADGEAGLRAMLLAPAHLILSDAEMPGMDGVTFLRAVRAHPPTAQTGFIMLTGRAEKSFVEKCIQYGVNNYILKPVTPEVLREKMEKVLGKLT